MDDEADARGVCDAPVCGRASARVATASDTGVVPPASASKDARRARVYAAEQQVCRVLDRAAGGTSTVDFFGSTLTVPVERRFADLTSVQRWVDAVLGLDAVRSRWRGVPGCTVRARRGAQRAHYEAPGVIAVPVTERWALRELVMCHELSHHLTDHDRDAHWAADEVVEPGHGRRFVDTYVALTDIVIGPEVALLLRAGLDEAGAV